MLTTDFYWTVTYFLLNIHSNTMSCRMLVCLVMERLRARWSQLTSPKPEIPCHDPRSPCVEAGQGSSSSPLHNRTPPTSSLELYIIGSRMNKPSVSKVNKCDVKCRLFDISDDETKAPCARQALHYNMCTYIPTTPILVRFGASVNPARQGKTRIIGVNLGRWGFLIFNFYSPSWIASVTIMLSEPQVNACSIVDNLQQRL